MFPELLQHDRLNIAEHYRRGYMVSGLCLKGYFGLTKNKKNKNIFSKLKSQYREIGMCINCIVSAEICMSYHIRPSHSLENKQKCYISNRELIFAM